MRWAAVVSWLLWGVLACRQIDVDNFPASERGACPRGFIPVGQRCHRHPPDGGGGGGEPSAPARPTPDAGVRVLDGSDPRRDAQPGPASLDGPPDRPAGDVGAAPSPDCPSGGCLHARRLAAGGDSTFAILPDGTLKSWGRNRWGILGYASDGGTSVRRPTAVPGMQDVRDIRLQGNSACAIRDRGEVYCWGLEIDGDRLLGSQVDGPGRVVVGFLGVSAVAVGGFHACLLFQAQVWCWGSNQEGQLGDVATTSSTLAGPVSGLEGLDPVTGLAAGYTNTCAQMASGSVRCWGSNDYGALGRADPAAAPTPVEVPGLSGVQEIYFGATHGCALMDGGAVRCWGNNTSGQLGNGTSSERPAAAPVAVTGLTGATVLAVGGAHSCALITDDTVRCWGRNLEGQLGDGSRRDAFTPVAVTGLTGVVGLAAGGRHTCAVLEGGAVQCWGANDEGQLGGTSPGSATPIPVLE